MKTVRFTTHLLTALTLVAALTACSKPNGSKTSPVSAEPTPAKATLSSDHIASSLSSAICKRIASCNQIAAGVSTDDCITALVKDLVDALPEKARVIPQATLDTCTTGIEKATCEELNSPIPPKDCGFME